MPTLPGLLAALTALFVVLHVGQGATCTLSSLAAALVLATIALLTASLISALRVLAGTLGLVLTRLAPVLVLLVLLRRLILLALAGLNALVSLIALIALSHLYLLERKLENLWAATPTHTSSL
jgi:hypothetical protein